MQRVETAASFLALGQRWFDAAEVEHGLMVGVAGEVRDAAVPPAGVRLALVQDAGGAVIGAALRTPPHALQVAGSAEVGAVIADAWDEPVAALPAVSGPAATADAFAARWCARGAVARVEHDLLLHELRAVLEVPPAAGQFRPALPADEALVVAAVRDFAAHTGMRDTDPAASARRSLASGQLSVWERDGAPVCLVRVSGVTPRGVRVSMVYTPAEHRGQGYATSCVAEVSRRQLAAGRTHCFLFTDAHAPGPNRVYARIGYRPVSEHRKLGFAPA